MKPSQKPFQLYSPQMERLMLTIGKHMSDDPVKWIQGTFITKYSSLYDFGLSDMDTEQIGRELSVKIPRDANLGKIADQILIASRIVECAYGNNSPVSDNWSE